MGAIVNLMPRATAGLALQQLKECSVACTLRQGSQFSTCVALVFKAAILPQLVLEDVLRVQSWLTSSYCSRMLTWLIKSQLLDHSGGAF